MTLLYVVIAVQIVINLLICVLFHLNGKINDSQRKINKYQMKINDLIIKYIDKVEK